MLSRESQGISKKPSAVLPDKTNRTLKSNCDKRSGISITREINNTSANHEDKKVKITFSKDWNFKGQDCEFYCYEG